MNKNKRKTISSYVRKNSGSDASQINVKSRQNRDSLSSVDELNNSKFSNSQRMLFTTLLTDPEKRDKVLELLTKEGLVCPAENMPLNGQLSHSNKKGNRVKVLSQENNISPLHSGRKKILFESPSSKLRRIELQKLHKVPLAKTYVTYDHLLTNFVFRMSKQMETSAVT